MAENHTPEAALTQEETNEQRQIRIDKLRAMQEEGRDPFQVMTAEQTHESGQARTYPVIRFNKRRGRGHLQGVQKAVGYRRYH